MSIADIISKLEIIIDNIEYEQISVDEVHEELKSLVHDIETSVDFDADFGDIQFNDLD